MSAFLDDMERRLADSSETFTSAEVRQLIDELMGLASTSATTVQAAHQQASATLQALMEKYGGANNV